MYQSEIYFKK